VTTILLTPHCNTADNGALVVVVIVVVIVVIVVVGPSEVCIAGDGKR
jgi:hypothetical protein